METPNKFRQSGSTNTYAKELICFLLFCCILSNCCLAQTANNNIDISVEIGKIKINDGTIYLAIFATAESFKKEEPDFLFKLEPKKTTLVQTVSLPKGEYVITAIQDANNNGKMDFGLLGVPKELFGISNYNGKGLPSRNFNKHKVLIDKSTTKITINLYKL